MCNNSSREPETLEMARFPAISTACYVEITLTSLAETVMLELTFLFWSNSCRDHLVRRHSDREHQGLWM